MYIVESNINTSYHGVASYCRARFAQKFMFKGYYTFSKALDGVDLQQSNVQVNVKDQSDLALDRARTSTDRRHNFVMSSIWDIDYFHDNSLPIASCWIIGHCQGSQPSKRFACYDQARPRSNLDGNNTDRANLVGDPFLDPGRSRNDVAGMWFNTSAFALPTNGTNGTSGRNILDGPGIRNVDLGIFRNFRIREGMNLQFRSELSNAFNLVSLNNPAATLGSNALLVPFGRPVRCDRFSWVFVLRSEIV